ncbi:FG-GAP repeat domain-containing protein [Streptosporangium sp. NPDC002721]|uniref:FG-GAP repeat domain-containing protein n=1 Tax=Streptosporangium sp. NPDC002721 TaxID=3366188 RepID=UPI0036BF9B68
MWHRRRVMGAALLTLIALAFPFPFPLPAAQAQPESNDRLEAVVDWDGDGHQDLLTWHSSGALRLFPGVSARDWSYKPPFTIVEGWLQYAQVRTAADWDRDGHQDLITADGRGIYLHPGDGVKAQAAAIKISSSSGNFDVRDAADWDRDGFQDLIVYDRKSGDIFMIPGHGKRDEVSSPWVLIARNFGDHDLRGVADWDGDGHQDLLLVEYDTKLLWLYPGEGVRGLSRESGVMISGGWNWLPDFPWPCAVADWDGDGHQDIIAGYLLGLPDRYSDLWLHPGEGLRGWSAQEPVRIQSGIYCHS